MENYEESLTAFVSCFARSYHATNSVKPIFNDFAAKKLLRPEEISFLTSIWTKAIYFFDPERAAFFCNEEEKLNWVMNTQCVPQLVSRAKYAEDQLLMAIQRGVRQYVILGAGLDTFALRQKNLPQDFRIYEIDLPHTQTFKIERLKEMGISIPDNLKFVPVDFSSDSLQDELKKAGFDEQEWSFFSLLGVSMYLDSKDFLQLLTLVSKISPRGSSFVFDYLDETALTQYASKKMLQMREMTAQTGEKIKTAFDPLKLDYEIQATNMLLYENLSPEQIEELYFGNQDNDLHAFDHFHFAHLVNNKE